MSIIKSFNSTIDYIETVLEDEIDEKKITHLSGYSYAMFSRLFSILTETTLSEYLTQFLSIVEKGSSKSNISFSNKIALK